MSNDAIAVFTGKSVETIVRDGGSCAWVLDRAHAIRARYLVCCRSGVEWVQGPEPQGSAFLVGIVSDIVPSSESPGRWRIKISEFARINLPEVWQGWRNPVRYTDLETLGIDAAKLAFEPMPQPESITEAPPAGPRAVSKGAIGPLTIPEAKRGLAQTFGVAEDAIEITIRG